MDFKKTVFKTADEVKNFANELHYKIHRLLDEVEIPEKLSYDKKSKRRLVIEDGKASLRRLETFKKFLENWDKSNQKQVLKLQDIIDIWAPVIKDIEKIKHRLEIMVPKERIAKRAGPTLPFYTNDKNE
ncbi:uncharacterized protein [Halyomorpha halys]|uniref:uncharacterized protein n=1 Tax=Halyomorpha halys TaxID=286706 RepID=UPI0006D4E444|nr:uncharacterized protein LOC106685270 [Halyomorpha halys]